MAIISTLVVALTARTTDFERDLKKTEKMLDQVGDRAESLGARLSVGLTAPLLGAATAASKLALDFNDSFDKMYSVLGKSSKETDLLRESVLKLAGQTAQGPKELGEALYGIEAAGISGTAALDILNAAAEGAAVGLGKSGNLANFLAAELNAYGPKAMSAAQATSVLIEAARVGRVKIDDLIGSVSSIMPLAAAAGVPFDQMAAAITSMTRAGLDAGQATTGLRTILTTIEKPSEGVQKALAMVGLSAAALKDELSSKGLLSALQSLKAATQGNDEALAQIFPSARTFGSVLSLLGANAKTTEDIFRQLAGTTTQTLGTAFARASSDDSFKLEQALVRVQSALIRLGNDLLPVIIPLIERFGQAVRDLSSWFERLDAGSKNLAIVLLSVVASVGPLLIAFSTLYSSLATVIGLFRFIIGMTGLANLFSAAAVAVSGLTAAMGELVGLFSAFGAAETISEVILPALAGSALLAGGLMAIAAYMWISKWNELKTDMGVIVDFITEKLSALNAASHGFLNGMFTAMFPALALLVRMKPAIQSALGGAADAAAKAGADLKVGFMAEMGDLEKGFGSVVSRILAKAKSMATGLVGSVKGLGGAGAPPPIPTSPLGPMPKLPSEDIKAQISIWESLGKTLKEQGSVMAITLNAFKANAIDAANSFKSSVHSMVSASSQSMGAMTAAFAKGQTSIGQFVQGMIVEIGKLIAKILLLRAITSIGLGGPFAAGFIGGMFAEGGRPPTGKVSIVGEKGPELFVPDTSGTIIPNSQLGPGVGAGGTVNVTQHFTVTGLDLDSDDSARRILRSLAAQMRQGAVEAVTLARATDDQARLNPRRAA